MTNSVIYSGATQGPVIHTPHDVDGMPQMPYAIEHGQQIPIITTEYKDRVAAAIFNKAFNRHSEGDDQ